MPPIAPDLTAPDTVITAAPAGPSDYLKVSFSFAGTDDVAPPTALRFECRLDAPPDPTPPPPEPPEPGEPPDPVDPTDPESWHECFSPAVYEFLEVGAHTFEVRAIDPAANVDFSAASYTWTSLDLSSVAEVDTSPPHVSVSQGPADPTTETDATIVFRGTDDVTPGLPNPCPGPAPARAGRFVQPGRFYYRPPGLFDKVYLEGWGRMGHR